MTKYGLKSLSILMVVLGLAVTLLPQQAQAERLVRKLTVDGLKREYIVYLPDNPSAQKTWPVLMAWHPGGASALWMQTRTRFHRSAAAKDYVVVYPDGHRTTFNAGNCCGPAFKKKVDDIAFFRAMMKDLGTLIPIEQKVYTTGFSNGAMMSFRLACELPDMVAAAAPFAGISPMSSCARDTKTPIMYFVGSWDRDAIDGASHSQIAGKSYDLPNARVTMNSVANARGCVAGEVATKRVNDLDSTCLSYIGCGGSEVMLCEIPGLGHRWPGSREPKLTAGIGKKDLGPFRPELNGTRAVLDFFNRH